MSLDGKSRKVLKSQNLSNPRAIVVDERSGSVTTFLHFTAMLIADSKSSSSSYSFIYDVTERMP